MQNKIALTGLRFSYADGQIDDLSAVGDIDSEKTYGPIRVSEITLKESELIVGFTIELSDDIPRKIGLTILRKWI